MNCLFGCTVSISLGYMFYCKSISPGHGHGKGHQQQQRGLSRQQLQQLLQTAQNLRDNDDGNELFWAVIIPLLQYMIAHAPRGQ